MSMIKFFIVCVVILFIGGILFGPDNIFLNLEKYDANCLDSIAYTTCVANNYSTGRASRAIMGNIGDFPVMHCYTNERSYEYDNLKFLDNELEMCKTKNIEGLLP